MLGSIAGLVGSLFTGRVIARFGTRRVLIFGGILSVGSLPIIGFATSPAMLVVGLTGVLFFDVFIDVSMNVQGSELSARRHTPVMNRLHGLWSLGTVTGAVATVALVRAGVDAPTQLAGTAVLLIGALVYISPGLLPVDADPHELEPAKAGEGRPAVQPVSRRFVGLSLAIGGAAAMTLEVSNGDWATFRLTDDLGASAGIAGLAFLGLTGGMTVGRLGGDWVQVRLGSALLLRVATVVAGVGSAVAALVPNIAVSIGGFFVAGLGIATLFPQLYDRAARAPGRAGSGFSAMLIGQRSAAIVSPLVVGALADTDVLGVGEAMAIVVLPAATLMFLTTLQPRTSAVRAG
jgi:MFS family permease